MSKHKPAHAAQLSLWEEPQPPIHYEMLQPLEPKEAYERRRVIEMAEKLYWPAVSMEAVRRWPGVTILEGAEAWHAFLAEASNGTIGLVMLALHDRPDPCYFGSIDEATGLKCHPVEVISQVEERYRACMMQLAELLEWPRISYWAANRTQVLGPGETEWWKYFEYGCVGLIADAVGALECRLRGEPEKVKQALRQQSCDDEEEE